MVLGLSSRITETYMKSILKRERERDQVEFSLEMQLLDPFENRSLQSFITE